MPTYGVVLILTCAFAPAAFLLILRIYFKSHPPDSSEAGVHHLQRGLTLGIISATALPILCILLYFRPASMVNSPYVLCALAGNVLNLVAITECLREWSGESLFCALVLFGLQLTWMFYAFSAFMSFA
jgi:hypothetical protein